MPSIYESKIGKNWPQILPLDSRVCWSSTPNHNNSIDQNIYSRRFNSAIGLNYAIMMNPFQTAFSKLWIIIVILIYRLQNANHDKISWSAIHDSETVNGSRQIPSKFEYQKNKKQFIHLKNNSIFIHVGDHDLSLFSHHNWPLLIQIEIKHSLYCSLDHIILHVEVDIWVQDA